MRVPGWLSNLNTLLTEKFPKFSSRLNEISGGRENMCLVSESLRKIVKFLRMNFFYCKVLWMVGKVNGNLSLSSFCEVSVAPSS